MRTRGSWLSAPKRASARTLTLAEKIDYMSKRTLKLLLGGFVAIILVAILARPVLIRYYLHQYNRSSVGFSRLYDSSTDPTLTATEMKGRVNSLHALYRLNYLAAYDIPIQNPRDDADDSLAQIASVSLMYRVPVSVKIVRATAGTVLRVIDRPENRENWAWITSLYMEQSAIQQMTDPNHKGPIHIRMP